MANAVILGAGRLGKGFLGETLANAPRWHTTFLDKDAGVIQKLNETGSYHVQVYRKECIEEQEVSGYEAYETLLEPQDCHAIVYADLLFLSIYPQDFPEAIAYVKEIFKMRAKTNPNQKLSMLCLTNKNGMIPMIQDAFVKDMNEELLSWFMHQVVIRDTIIRRSTDADDHRSLNIRSTAVLSLLIQPPLTIDIADIEWLELCDDIAMLKDIKVFLVNGPHAASAYLGWYRGYTTINELLEDEDGAAFIQEVTKEIRAGILQQYPISEEQLDKLSVFPKAKGDMPDTVYRVGKDPLRKLSYDDRLCGSARMCKAHHLPYEHIVQAIAYGLLYDEKTDEAAMQMQMLIQEKGIIEAVHQICGFSYQEDLLKEICSWYVRLKNK